MRIWFVLSLAVGLLMPAAALAQGPQHSSLQISRAVLGKGQTQTIAVTARDLVGAPLVGASVKASVHYGRRVAAYGLTPTDRSGRTTLSFSPPGGVAPGRALVYVSISNGFLAITLSGSFRVAGGKGTIAGQAGSSTTAARRLVVVARAVPPAVTAPSPVWLVVVVRDTRGVGMKKTPVSVAALFKGGTRHLSGMTDAHGVATIKLDTTSVRASETVQVGIVAHSGTVVGSAATQFSVKPHASAPRPTPSPTLTPTSTPSPSPTPTSTPVPTPTSIATPTVTPTTVGLAPIVFIPVPTARSAPTMTPTAIPASTATSTAVPTPTSTPVPTPTATVAPSSQFFAFPSATATPLPYVFPTATSSGDCPGSMQGCMQAVLNMINQTRARNGVAPLELNDTESMGTGSCPGSYGHSLHMAQTGTLAHDQFPADICVRAFRMGENIGYFGSGNELTDLQWIHNEMMKEPYTVGCQGNHACNITYPGYSQVGIGIVVSGNTTWLTEDFLG